MRDNRDILDKLKWLSTDMEDMEVPGDWLLPVNEAHSIIVRMREETERLRVALNRLADEPFSDLESVRAFVCSVLRRARND